MRLGIALALLTAAAFTGSTALAEATPPAQGLTPGSGGATFRFTTSVTTPKGSHSGAGTVTIKRTGTRAASLTVQSDGKPAQTIALIVGVDGSVSPDPSSAPAEPADPDAKAQAQAFMSEMTIAAHVGIGARKSGGATSYTVPVMLAPVGKGTPVAAQLAMSGSATQYAGTTSGQTTTELPPGGVDPKQIAKTIGVSAIAAETLSPRGRVITAVHMHRKSKHAKEAASGVLPDALSLSVNADLADGKVHEIRGAQTDAIAIPGNPVKIQSNWTFTKIAG